ncbi:MAG: E3 binding domain-containing protein, partial [Polyangiaceae bacterium]|nr:E3 binding domain-containing protein [Polyangiaceae bacterium]
MAKILDMPKLSPTMEEGVLSAWHKKEGDEIAVDDLLAEVETDKATMEFRAFDKGTLLKLLVTPGAQVKLGQPVAIVGAAGEDTSALVAQATGGAGGSAPAPQPASQEKAQEKPGAGAPPTSAPPIASTQPETAPPVALRKPPVGNVLERTSYSAEPPPRGSGNGHAQGGRVIASPFVRKTARELGIDLQGAQGTGPGGRVLPADLEGLKSQNSAALTRVSPSAPTGPGNGARGGMAAEEAEVRPLTQMRKAIARRLTESKQTVPHFYLSIDVDASELVKLREQINRDLASETSGGAANGEGPHPT